MKDERVCWTCIRCGRSSGYLIGESVKRRDVCRKCRDVYACVLVAGVLGLVVGAQLGFWLAPRRCEDPCSSAAFKESWPALCTKAEETD